MMKIRNRSRKAAFTLIELLCVIASVAMLATLLFPVIGSIAQRGRFMKCQNNLRQLCIAVNAAANDNENRFPAIEPDIENPVHSGDEPAKPIFEVLAPYGVTEKVLQCPDDLSGPNFYEKKKTSYEWQVFVEDELTNRVTIYTPRFNFPVPPSRVRLFNDWTPVHPDFGTDRKLGQDKEEYTTNRMNVVFGDGHVVAVRPAKPRGGSGGRGGGRF
jgi:prepilin-type processing-associated H-X9-DG protein